MPCAFSQTALGGSLTLVARREPRILSGGAAGREGLLIGSL